MRRFTQMTAVHLRPTTVAYSQSSQASTSNTSKEKWDRYASVLVERLPVVSHPLNPLQTRFQELLWRVEYETSLKSNHEQHDEHDLKQADLLKKGLVEVDLDENASKQTAQDLKDDYTEELKQFKATSCNNDDDTAKNTMSLDRNLKNTLYLLMEQKLGNQKYLLLPQGLHRDGESMREAAERVLRERCGDQLQVQFYGHAPCGFYKYKYPSALLATEGAALGAKVFFYRAVWYGGNMDKTSTTAAGGFMWLSRPELERKLPNSTYVKSLQQFLL